MQPLTLNEVELLLDEARTAKELFARASYEELTRATLPGRVAGDEQAEALFARVQILHDHFRRLQQLYAELTAPPVVLAGPRHTYTLLRLLAAGDVADVHLTTAEYDPALAADPCYVLKVARVPEGNAFLENERRALAALLTAAGDTTYRRYFPTLAESFLVGGGTAQRVNAFLFEPGLYSLPEVREQHPALDGRHLAWIFKRLLTALGFAHRQGVVHGAVLPCHVLVQPASRGLQLVGWGHCVPLGEPLRSVPTPYRAWCPPEALTRRPATAATDLFLAARSLVHLAGGDPLTGRLPDTVPAPLQGFFRGCLLEGPQMRPGDAWALLDEFDELLEQLYGPPKFHHLPMS
jgi:serine/threonine protein kinase